MLDPEIKLKLHQGAVIPAHPLALHPDRTLDQSTQKLLTKYYLASGAGGLAIGVHTTQFAIRDAPHFLYEKVLELGIEAIEEARSKNNHIIKVAGVSGHQEQAIQEAKIAQSLGYDLALLSTNNLSHLTEAELLTRAEAIAEIMPIFGFYLQPAVGGRRLSEHFWQQMSEIPNLHAIKIAPFNRYQTLDVVRGVCLSKRHADIALYTGNDDNILLDLLTTFTIHSPQGIIKKDIVGGLLGHWAVWTKKAVALLEEIKQIKREHLGVSGELLTRAMAITDTNAAFFDAKNNYAGCIAGLHEVLRRQGLMKNVLCLDPKEGLSPGQIREIDRVYREYPDLNDDVFVAEFLTQLSK